MTKNRKVYRPQAGKQFEFLKNSADIIFYGGSAGSGKTYAILLDALWYHDRPGFTGIIFRRTSPQLTSPGGMWYSSQEMYREFGGVANQTSLEWKFPSGSLLKMSHLQHDKDIYSHQGAQYAAIYFDEVVHFTREQFFYMFSRNRSTCGIKPFIKATCNPDADSWVRVLIDWYINPETGLAITERSGIIRWFIVREDEIIWADSKQELLNKYHDCLPKSFTFISASIFDNKKLLEIDPGYLANLHALPYVERERLLNGNWNIKPSSGMYFKASYFEVLDAIPRTVKKIRYWDRASTKKTETNDPDATVGIKIEKGYDGLFYVTDMVRIFESPLGVEQAIRNTASRDGKDCHIYLEQDPGQAGKVELDYLTRSLAGYVVKSNKVSQDKVTRALPVSSQCEAGNVKILRASWNDIFFRELENFPQGKHDDIVDSLSGAFNMILDSGYSFDKLAGW